MSQHTPTPVKAVPLSRVTRALLEANGTRPGPDEHEIEDSNGDLFAIAPDKFSAKIIVRAVNSHEALLAAAKLAFELSPMSSSEKFSKALNALNKAIAQAEGK